jgi:hypothetical protein
MKKILSIFSASLLALLAFSCVTEEFATFDETKATAPVIGSYELGEKALTISYTPGAFNMGFNDRMPVNHSLILASVDGKPVNKALTASFKDTEVSVTINNLAKALIGLGYQEGNIVSMDMFIRASLQAPNQDNGRNGYVDSQGHITINGFEVFIPVVQGNPWEAFTEKSDWSLIGSIVSTGNAWNKDEPVFKEPDGKKHVAKNVKLTPDDQFKFRYKKGWDVNRGAPGDTEPYVMNAGDEVEATQNGKNLAVAVAGNYDILYDEESETITVTEAFQTYPGFDKKSNWSVIGSIASISGMNWNKDVSMTTDGEWHVCEGVVLTTGDQFKFRMDQGWDTNIGAPGDTEPFVVTLDEEQTGVGGGKNLSVPADGTYDLLCNPAAGLYKVVVSLGGHSPLVGEDEGDEPGPDEPETVTGWNLIGFNGDWDHDLAATEINGVWTVFVTAEEDTQFKWRKDGSWTENYGGAMDAVGEPFEAVAGGADIPLAAGSWKIELNTEAKTITVSEVKDAYTDFTENSPWGAIGSIASRKINWDNDVSMRTNGTWHVAEGVTLTASDQFKFRKDQSWDENFGGPTDGGEPVVVTIGEELAAFGDGKNLAVPADGIYDLLLNPDAGLIKVVESLGGFSPNINNDQPGPEPVAVEGWNVIGLNNDWENDILASEKDGVWTAYLSVAENTEFKWRKDGAWDENYGGTMAALGEPFDALAGGANIPLEPGFYKVELNTTELKITVSEGIVWSVIGDFNSWGGDVDMIQDGNLWVADGVELSGGWKIRFNHAWDDDRGGTFAELGEAFAVNKGGSNIDCGEGMFKIVYDPEAETITVTEAKVSSVWSVIGINGDWGTDIDMTEVMPGVWVSPEITTTSSWKVRFDHAWDADRGGEAPSAEGVFVKAVPGGSNVELTGTFRVVYNANNETLGTLVWGVVGSVASIDGFNWNNDVPMNLGSDGKWYSIPIVLGDGDEIKIRKYAAWDENRGGDCVSANEAFAVTGGGNNIKAPAAGTYMLVYDPENETITLSTEFWSLIGDFNSWGGDVFMICNGSGEWAAYGQSLSGGWKVRQGAGWEVNRGGSFVEKGTAFEAVPGGDNINVGDLTGFDIVYDSKAETITVK